MGFFWPLPARSTTQLPIIGWILSEASQMRVNYSLSDWIHAPLDLLTNFQSCTYFWALKVNIN
jgi:hypothetical protein